MAVAVALAATVATEPPPGTTGDKIVESFGTTGPLAPVLFGEFFFGIIAGVFDWLLVEEEPFLGSCGGPSAAAGDDAAGTTACDNCVGSGLPTRPLPLLPLLVLFRGIVASYFDWLVVAVVIFLMVFCGPSTAAATGENTVDFTACRKCAIFSSAAPIKLIPSTHVLSLLLVSYSDRPWGG